MLSGNLSIFWISFVRFVPMNVIVYGLCSFGQYCFFTSLSLSLSLCICMNNGKKPRDNCFNVGIPRAADFVRMPLKVFGDCLGLSFELLLGNFNSLNFTDWHLGEHPKLMVLCLMVVDVCGSYCQRKIFLARRGRWDGCQTNS